MVAILPYTKMPDTDEITFQKGELSQMLKSFQSKPINILRKKDENFEEIFKYS